MKMRKLLLVSLLAFFMLPLSGQVSENGVIPLSQERSRDFDVLHYRIELSVDLEKKYLKGQNTIYIGSSEGRSEYHQAGCSLIDSNRCF